MIFLKITGGLGNQMFQFATALAIAKKLKTKVGIDLTEINIKKNKKNFTYRDFQLDQIFTINSYKIIPSFTYDFITKNTFLNKIKRKLIGGHYFLEKDLSFQPEIKNCTKNSYIEGYFQSEKYFINHEKEIRNQFKFSKKTNSKTKDLVVNISNCNSIAIHIRRGDYINNKVINDTHGTCGLDYYKNALSQFNLNNYSLFFFSDDINWVKDNFDFISPDKITFIDWNTGHDSWQDMFLMSLCQNFIIANSSFSWWGAWLSAFKDKKIITPKQWFNDNQKNKQTIDLIPKQWIRI